MKKLMKIRRTKKPIQEEKERNESLGMELPSDTFIKEISDTQPFVVEVENDEKSFNGSDNILSATHFITKADDADEKVCLDERLVDCFMLVF